MVIKFGYIQSITCLLYLNYVLAVKSYSEEIIEVNDTLDSQHLILIQRLENIINEKVLDLQTVIFTKLEVIIGLQYDMQRDLKDLKSKMDQQTINSTQIIELAAKEKEVLDSIGQINNRLILLEAVPDQIKNNTILIQSVRDNCGKINTSTATEGSPVQPEIVTTSNISISRHLPPDSGERYELRGTVDKLDRSMMLKKKCKYMEFERGSSEFWFSSVFDGKVFEAHFAIRTDDYVKITASWGKDTRFNFLIGVDRNRLTIVEEAYPINVSQRITPNILSKNSYMQFYVKINNDTLIFGKECDTKPLFTSKTIKIAKEDVIKFSFDASSVSGAKVLYKCPVDVACDKPRIPMGLV